MSLEIARVIEGIGGGMTEDLMDSTKTVQQMTGRALAQVAHALKLINTRLDDIEQMTKETTQ